MHRTLDQALARLKQRSDHAGLTRSILQLLKIGAGRRNDVFFRIMAEVAFANPALFERVRNELHGQQSPARPKSDPAPEQLSSSDLDNAALMHLLFVVVHGYMWTGDFAFGEERIDAERLADTLATLLGAVLPTRD
jgi:hypothetical protein